MQIIIPSKGRSDVIADKALRLFPDATLCIGDDAPPGAALPAMECQPFEHHDYIMLMFRNDQDFQQACELLGIKKVQITYPGGLQKVGLSRVIDGAKAIGKLAGTNERASRRETC